MKRRIGILVSALIMVLMCSALAFSQQQQRNQPPKEPTRRSDLKVVPADLAA
jgi:hypothetical protein